MKLPDEISFEVYHAIAGKQYDIAKRDRLIKRFKDCFKYKVCPVCASDCTLHCGIVPNHDYDYVECTDCGAVLMRSMELYNREEFVHEYQSLKETAELIQTQNPDPIMSWS